MMPLALKAVNAELKKRGLDVELAKGQGYFYFRSGDAANWLDTTVRVPTLSSLSLEQWIAEFERLKKLNERFASEVGKTLQKSEGDRLKRSLCSWPRETLGRLGFSSLTPLRRTELAADSLRPLPNGTWTARRYAVVGLRKYPMATPAPTPNMNPATVSRVTPTSSR
jgi:hypothetical protein